MGYGISILPQESLDTIFNTEEIIPKALRCSVCVPDMPLHTSKTAVFERVKVDEEVS